MVAGMRSIPVLPIVAPYMATSRVPEGNSLAELFASPSDDMRPSTSKISLSRRSPVRTQGMSPP